MKPRFYLLVVVPPSDRVIAYDTEAEDLGSALDNAYKLFGDDVEVILIEELETGMTPLFDLQGQVFTKAEIAVAMEITLPPTLANAA
jgi:hypothetical protein